MKREVHGVDISNHLRRLFPESLEAADLVIAMTQSQYMLLARYPEFGRKVFTLSEIRPETGGDVIDPYGKSREKYDKTGSWRRP